MEVNTGLVGLSEVRERSSSALIVPTRWEMLSSRIIVRRVQLVNEGWRYHWGGSSSASEAGLS